MGQIVGGILIITLLSGLLARLLRARTTERAAIFIAVPVVVVLAIVLYAFGSADGGPPRWRAGILPYSIGGIAALAVLLFRARPKRKEMPWEQ